VTYRTILVHVDNGPRVAVRVEIACQLANKFDAHLVGLHALSAVRLPTYARVEGGEWIAEYHGRASAELARLGEQAFKRAVAASGVAKSEWRVTRENATEAVPLHARYADLTVIGQPNASEGVGVEPDFAERVLLAAGRPVLVIPYAGDFPGLGERVLIAWNASREATRAVTDALPLLRKAREVHVIAFNPSGAPHGDVPGADIGLYLARHDIKVSVSQQTARDIDVGNQLLSRAADLSADLIVMGGYGHSRTHELILGGVTRTVFQSMTVPVLMSH